MAHPSPKAHSRRPGSELFPSSRAKLIGGPRAGVAAVVARKRAKSSCCVVASIFADCFGECTGVIDGSSPGPVCGWTFIEPFGALGGLFTFTPGVMSMDTAGATQFAIATKSLPASLASVLGVSGQFDFTEYPTTPNAETTYQIFMNNSDISEVLSVSLFGDGSVVVQAGDVNSVPTYVGAWTPNAGAHVVHFSIDGSGVPTLWLDGVEITLDFYGNVESWASSYPANSINYGGGAAVATSEVSPLRSLFITEGATGPETVFCCP